MVEVKYTQVTGEDGDGVAFMSELAGNGSAKLWANAYNGCDASTGG